MKNRLTKWHRAYIQNASRELEEGTTRKRIDAMNLDASGKKVLDVGCGPGNLLVALWADAPELLIGVDVDENFLKFGQAHIAKVCSQRHQFPRLMYASVAALPFADATFDIVTCFLVMPHVPDDKAALAELARVLKTGGTLAITGHSAGFPLKYLKQCRTKPLLMYLASLIYRCTGKKWIQNTLQTEKQMCRILTEIGLVPEGKGYTQKTLGFVETYWIRAVKANLSKNTPTTVRRRG